MLLRKKNVPEIAGPSSPPPPYCSLPRQWKRLFSLLFQEKKKLFHKRKSYLEMSGERLLSNKLKTMTD